MLPLPPRPAPARPRGLALLSLLSAMALCAPPVVAEALQPLGPTHLVDRLVDCDGRQPSVAVRAGGGFVTAWAGGGALWWRPLDSTGVPLGEPVVIATGVELADPKVVARLDGGSAVAWFDGATERVRVRTVTAGGSLGPALDVGGLAAGAEFHGLDAATTPEGHVAVAWTGDVELWLRELRPDGTWVGDPARLIPDDVLAPPPVEHDLLFDPAVVGVPGGVLHLFFVASFAGSGGVGELRGVRVGPATEAGTYPEPVAVEVPFRTGIDQKPAVVAAAQGGGFLLAWLGDFASTLPILPIPLPVVLAQRYDSQGNPASVATHVDEAGHRYGSVAATASADGRFVVAWDATGGLEVDRPRAFAATLGAAGELETAAVAIADEASWGQAQPALAAGPGGLVASVWQEVEDPDIVHVVCPGARIRARALQIACGSDGAFCVGDGRFALSLRYFDPRRGIPEQAAAGEALTADAGYFWFRAPDNVEVIVKVLDGRALNGHFWVFYGGLTDLGFDLTVRDTFTGGERVFRNPPGTMASRGVTDALLPAAAAGTTAATEVRSFRVAALARDAFAGEGGAAPPRLASERPAPRVAELSPPAPPGPCRDPSRPGLCLNGGRFNFIVDWRSFDGASGVGHGVPLGDDSGYFWFFDPDNVELVVKALDGRAVNGKFWIFYGALTNVQYSIGVWHAVDSVWDLPQVIYENPLGHFASVADVDAFTPPVCTCPAVEAPVCGRDGRTYGSDCQAYCVGWVEIAHPGACTGD